MRSDAEIVRSVIDGDREAFAMLVTRHERAVWATAWRVLRDDHAASDVAQEAFLRAFRGLAHLREPTRFGVWVLRIARREAIRLARKRPRPPMLSLDVTQGMPAAPKGATRLDDDDASLINAVARLPESERLVVVMYYLEGRPVAEVAQALGRPVGTVTKQLSRAVQRLRNRLKVCVMGVSRGHLENGS